MPLVPNLLERLLLRSNQVPGAMLDLASAAVFRALGAALNLGVLEELGDGELALAELAQRTGCSENGLARLLDVLAATGYVARRDGRFRNTPATRKWLLRNSPDSAVDFIVLWVAVAFDQWSQLEDAVRSGRATPPMHEWLASRPDGWTLFNAAMRAAAKRGAEEVAQRVPLPASAQRLLDVGGSHGLYTAAFCRRHPQLSATIFDGPEALVSARQTIADLGLEGRVDTRAGDMTTDDLGSGFDALLLFNVIHYFDAAQNQALLRKAAAALNPGGTVVIFDQLTDSTPLPITKVFVEVLSLQYFAGLGSRVYSSGEIGGWLQGAGFGAPKRTALRSVPGVYLLTAVR